MATTLKEKAIKAEKATVKKAAKAKIPTVKKTQAAKEKTEINAVKKLKRILIIVESPAKAKSIEKYLGPSYTVKASMGHLIDLPKSRLAIDVDNNFEPEYITVRGRAKLLKELQTDAKKSDGVLLAPDPDREGEAIAWHLKNAIQEKNTGLPISRITFNEVTPQAVKAAIAAPRSIDDSKVNAQIARRVLDRLVGYNLSPLLWKKVKNGLSAGRVQSVALRLICERERELEAFIPEEYWTIDAYFSSGGKSTFQAALVLWKGEKPALKKEADAAAVIKAVENKEFVVGEIRETSKTLRPRPPFTTSQLQQTAANRLGWTSKKTMQVAQQLYEGVNLGASRIGLITYMRTDSVRISDSAINEAREWIAKNYPAALPPSAQHYAVGKSAQDAHEAIRPTYIKHTPDTLKDKLPRDLLRLYTLIWERFTASQMSPAKTLTLSADIIAGDAVFRVSGTKVVEKGYMEVLKMLAQKDENIKTFPAIKQGSKLKAQKIEPLQHWTQGPARFTDASIIKTLEEKGIGRPSTFAPTISVIIERYYVTRSNKQLVPTVLGKLINDMLVENFGDVVNADFTAGMETGLDEVEAKSRSWTDLVRDFYQPFKLKVDEVGKNLESLKGNLVEATGEVCEKCGKPMLKKLGRFGYFLACAGFPECRTTKSIPLGICPKCGSDIVARKTRGRGKEFYGCIKYPECDFLTHFKPLQQNCPKCGWFLVEKYDKRNGSHKACINPACDYLHQAEEE